MDYRFIINSNGNYFCIEQLRYNTAFGRRIGKLNSKTKQACTTRHNNSQYWVARCTVIVVVPSI